MRPRSGPEAQGRGGACGGAPGPARPLPSAATSSLLMRWLRSVISEAAGTEKGTSSTAYLRAHGAVSRPCAGASPYPPTHPNPARPHLGFSVRNRAVSCAMLLVAVLLLLVAVLQRPACPCPTRPQPPPGRAPPPCCRRAPCRPLGAARAPRGGLHGGAGGS